MLMYWLVSSILAGEVILFLVFMTVDRGRPRRVGSGFLYFALCLGLFAMAGTSFWAYRDTLHRVQALDDVLTRQMTVRDLMRCVREMESSQRGYLLVDKTAYLEQYHRNKARAPGRLDAVRVAYAGSADATRVDDLCRLVRLKVEEMDKMLALHRRGETIDALEFLTEGRDKNLMDLACTSVDDLNRRTASADHEVRKQLQVVAKARIAIALLVMAGAVLQMIIGAIYGWPASHTLDPDRLRECPA